MNDSIFHLILLSQDKDLAESKNILQRIERRELYTCVGQTTPMKGITKDDVKKIKEDIMKCLSCLPQSSGQLNERDLSVHISLMLPGVYAEQLIRLYCKKTDKKSLQLAKDCFQEWFKDKGILPATEQHSITPE